MYSVNVPSEVDMCGSGILEVKQLKVVEFAFVKSGDEFPERFVPVKSESWLTNVFVVVFVNRI